MTSDVDEQHACHIGESIRRLIEADDPHFGHCRAVFEEVGIEAGPDLEWSFESARLIALLLVDTGRVSPRLEPAELLELGRSLVSENTGGRPDFSKFVEDLRSEAKWVGRRRQLPAGNIAAQVDEDALRQLADKVEAVGRQLGLL